MKRTALRKRTRAYLPAGERDEEDGSVEEDKVLP